MADFQAQVKAVLDQSSLSTLQTQIQNALNNKPFKINIDGLNLSNLTRQGQQVGQQLGQQISQQMSNNITSALKKINVNNGLGSISNMNRMLKSAGLDHDSISVVTQDLDKMLVTISKISSTQLANGNIRMSISGVDELNRALNIVKIFDAENNRIFTSTKSISQSFETASASAKRYAKEVSEAGKAQQTLTKSETLANKIGKYMNENAEAAEKYKATLTSFMSTLNRGNTSSTVLSRISAEFQRIKSEVDLAKSSVESLGNQLNTTDANKLARINLKINDGDFKLDLDRIESQYNKLNQGSQNLASNIGKLKTAFQTMSSGTATVDEKIQAFERFNAILPTVNKELREATAATKEFQNTANQIKDLNVKLEAGGKIGNDIRQAEESFRALNSVSDVTASNMQKLREAFVTMSDTSASDEARLAAYKRFYEILPPLTTELNNATKAQKEMQTEASKMSDFEYKINLGGIGDQIEKARKEFNSLTDVSDKVKENMGKLEDAFSTINDSSQPFDVREKAVKRFNETLSVLKTQLRDASKEEKEFLDSALKVADMQFRIDIGDFEAKINKVTNSFNQLKNAPPEVEANIRRLNQAYADMSDTSLSDKERLAAYKEFNTILPTVTNQVNQLTAAQKRAEQGTSTFGKNLRNAIKMSIGIGSVYQVFNKVTSAIKNGVKSVIDLDTSLLDLKKTTTASAEELNIFYNRSNEIAKTLGSTTQQVIQAAADWSRLGYNIKDAEIMAQTSSIFASISPGMDIEKATDGLVSVMKAFKIEASDALDEVASKINIIGNTKAVSNSDIVEMLTRSSAAMDAANNTLDQTIALGTAATEITRNASLVGTALRTISMRIRGFDEETEEYVGGIEQLSGKIADLTKTAKTPGGLSLFTDETKETYKSTYQLLADISEIYDELTDKQQAQLLEQLGGKRGGQVIASILTNFSSVEESLKSMENAAGSAMKEMSIVEETIEFKLNKLRETGVGIWQNLIDRGELGKIIDALSGLLEIIDSITESIGALPVVIGGIGIIGFVSSIQSISSGMTAFNKSMQQATQLTGQAASGASKFGTSMKGVGSTVAAAVSFLGILVSGLMALSNAFDAQIRKSAEAADNYNATKKSVKDYIDQAETLQQKLNEGNLSEAEAKSVKSELVEIESNLVELLGSEASGLDLVNRSLSEQLGLVDQLLSKEWKKYYQENVESIDTAVDRMTHYQGIMNGKNSGNGVYRIYAPKASDLIAEGIDPTSFYNDFNKELGKIFGRGLANPDELASGLINWDFGTSNIYEVADLMHQLSGAVDTLGHKYLKTDDILNSHLGQTLKNYGTVLKDNAQELAKYETIFDTYVQGLVQYDSEYSTAYGNIIAAQKEFLKAYEENDIEAMKKADADYQKAVYEFRSKNYDNEAVKLFVEQQIKEFSEDTEYQANIKIRINDDIVNSEEVKKSIVHTLDSFMDENGQIDLALIAEAEVQYNRQHNKNPRDTINNETNVPSESMQAYEQLVAIAQEYGIVTENNTANVNGLIAVLCDLGVIDLDNIVNSMEDVGDETKNASKNLSAFSKLVEDASDSGFSKRIESYTEKISSLKDVLEKIKSGELDKVGGELSQEDIINLAIKFPELAPYVNDTKELQKAIEDVITASGMDMDEYLNEIIEDTPEARKEVEILRKALLSIADIAIAPDGYKELLGILDGFGPASKTAVKAVEKLNAALQQGSYGSGLESRAENYLKMLEKYQQGEVGDSDFRAYAEYFGIDLIDSIDENGQKIYKTYEQIGKEIEAVGRYAGAYWDSSSNKWATDADLGMKRWLDDISNMESEFVSFDQETKEFSFDPELLFNPDKLSKVAKEMGVTSEFFIDLLNNLRKFSLGMGEYSNEELQAALETAGLFDGKVLDINKMRETLSSLGYSSDVIQEIIDRAKTLSNTDIELEISTESLDDANEAFAELWGKIYQMQKSGNFTPEEMVQNIVEMLNGLEPEIQADVIAKLKKDPVYGDIGEQVEDAIGEQEVPVETEADALNESADNLGTAFDKGSEAASELDAAATHLEKAFSGEYSESPSLNSRYANSISSENQRAEQLAQRKGTDYQDSESYDKDSVIVSVEYKDNWKDYEVTLQNNLNFIQTQLAQGFNVKFDSNIGEVAAAVLGNMFVITSNTGDNNPVTIAVDRSQLDSAITAMQEGESDGILDVMAKIGEKTVTIPVNYDSLISADGLLGDISSWLNSSGLFPELVVDGDTSALDGDGGVASVINDIISSLTNSDDGDGLYKILIGADTSGAEDAVNNFISTYEGKNVNINIKPFDTPEGLYERFYGIGSNFDISKDLMTSDGVTLYDKLMGLSPEELETANNLLNDTTKKYSGILALLKEVEAIHSEKTIEANTEPFQEEVQSVEKEVSDTPVTVAVDVEDQSGNLSQKPSIVSQETNITSTTVKTTEEIEFKADESQLQSVINNAVEDVDAPETTVPVKGELKEIVINEGFNAPFQMNVKGADEASSDLENVKDAAEDVSNAIVGTEGITQPLNGLQSSAESVSGAFQTAKSEIESTDDAQLDYSTQESANSGLADSARDMGSASSQAGTELATIDDNPVDLSSQRAEIEATKTSAQNAIGTFQNLASAMSSLPSGGMQVQQKAKGTKSAKQGLALLGDEYSADGTPRPELVVSDGEAYIAGVNGPTFANLKSGDIVYTYKETKKILAKNKFNGNLSKSIPAFSLGRKSSIEGLDKLNENLPAGYRSGSSSSGTVYIDNSTNYDVEVSSEISGDASAFAELIKNSEFKEFVDSFLSSSEKLQSAFDNLSKGAKNTEVYDDLFKAFDEDAEVLQILGKRSEFTAEKLQLLSDLFKSRVMEGFNGAFGSMVTDADIAALQNYMDTILEMGNVTKTALNIDSFKEKMDSLYSAIRESVSATGLSAESIAQLEGRYRELEGFNIDTLFEYTANGIRVNTKELRALESEYQNIQKANIQKQLRDLQKEYARLTQEIENYQEGVSEASQTELYSQRDSIEAQIKDVERLTSQYDGLLSTYNKWVQAQSMGEEGDMYNDIVSNLENILELYEDGLVGTNKFRAAVQLLTNQDVSSWSANELVDTFQRKFPILIKYFTETKDGAEAFLNDVMAINSEWVKLGSDGSWDINIPSIKALSDALGLNIDTIELMLRRLQDYGLDISFDVNAEINQPLDELKSIDNFTIKDKEFSVNIDNSSIEEAKARLQELGNQFNALNNGNIDYNNRPHLNSDMMHDAGWDDFDDGDVATLYTSGYTEKAVKYPIAFEITPILEDGTVLTPEALDEYVASLDLTGGLEEFLASDAAALNLVVNAVPGEYEDNEAYWNDYFAKIELIKQAYEELYYSIFGYPWEIDTVLNTEEAEAQYEQLRESIETSEVEGTAIWNNDTTEVDKFLSEELVKEGHVEWTDDSSGESQGSTQQDETSSDRGASGGGTLRDRAGKETEAWREKINKGKKGASAASGSGYANPPGNSSDSSSEDEPEKVDWIEIAIKRIQTAIDKLKNIANSAFKVLQERLNASAKEINKVTEEISLQSKAYDRYMKEANSIKLSDDLKKRVREGAIDINLYDSSTRELITEYQEFFEKAIDCRDAVEELHETLSELYQERFDTVQEDYNNQLDVYEAKVKALEGIEYTTVDKNNKNLSKTIDLLGNKSDVLYQEYADLTTMFDDAVKNGGIKKYSEAWYEMNAAIDDVTQNIIDNYVEMADAYNDIFENIESAYSDRISLLSKDLDALSNNEFASTGTNNKGATSSIDIYRNQLGLLKKELSELVAARDKAVDSGTIVKGSEAWSKMQETIKDVNNEILETHKNIAGAFTDVFDNLESHYSNFTKSIGSLTAQYNTAIETATTKGYLESTKYYSDLSKIENKNISTLKQELKSLEGAMTNAMNSGEITKYSSAWFDMQSSIDGVKHELAESNLQLIKYANTMRELEWSYFDLIQEKISEITDEANFFVKLFSNKQLFEDNGQLTDNGMSTMGLRAQNYDVAMIQANKYASEIKKINKDIAKDPYNTTLLNRRKELISLQRESILAAESEKDAIKSLVSEGINKELASMKDLIDGYTESLNNQKSLYDYQQNIEKQTKNIATLRKQLAAYSGDLSSETQAKVQKIQVELEDAEKELQETEYDKFISDTTKLLDDMYTEYDEMLNSRLDNIDALMEDMIRVVNENSGTIGKTIDGIASDVGYSVSSGIKTIWDESANGINGTVAMYGAGIEGNLTNVGIATMAVAQGVQEQIDYANANAAIANAGIISTSIIMGENAEKLSKIAENLPSNTGVEYGINTVISDMNTNATAIKSSIDSIWDLLDKNLGNTTVKKSTVQTAVNTTSSTVKASAPKATTATTASKTSSNDLQKKAEDMLGNMNMGQAYAAYRIASSNTLNILSDLSKMPYIKAGEKYPVSTNVNVNIDKVMDYNDFVKKMQNDATFQKLVESMTTEQLAGKSSLTKYGVSVPKVYK